MSGIIKKYDQFKENTYFAGGKFVIYAACVCLAATFAVGCLGLIIGFPLLTFPLAMLISNPVVWVLMEVVVTAAYKMVVEPLFHLAKNYINGKRASKGEKSEEKSPEQEQPKKNQERPKTPDRDSGIGDDISIGSTENKQSKQTKIVRYNTARDGNCFFHAVFGDNSSDQYKAEKAQDMRMEWHKFLSQFTSLNDPSMPAPLKAQLGKVFNIFLNKPEDLTGKSDKIKRLAKYTNRKVEKIERKVKQLKKKLLCIGLQENEVDSNLKEFAVGNFFSARRYDKNYNSESVANSFLNSKLIYQSYLEAISNQSYYVFIEEIPILASLANIAIDVHYKNNGGNVHKVFKPNSEMINENYQQNNEWGNKEHEIIYLKHGHYERAKIVELKETQSVFEKVGSVVQAAAASIRDAFGLNT